MLIATFGPTTPWAGRRIRYEEERFFLEGYQPPISARDVLNYHAQGQLEWTSSEVRAWVEEVAGISIHAVPPASGRVGVGGFVWALLGFLFPLFSIPGLILSLKARKRARAQNLPSGLAMAGIIISAIGLALIPVYLITNGFFVMIPLSNNMDCGGSTSATEQLDTEIAKYQAAVKADPKDVASWRSLAENYVLRANQQAQGSAAQKADWRTAAQNYEKADELLKKQNGAAAEQLRMDTLQQLVSVYLFLKDYRVATSVYGQITALKPTDAQSFFDMATVAISAGDTNAALHAFTRFLELDPTSPDAASVRDWIAANSGTPAPSPAP
jgi:tetratricopeptide (TPR) repeat protein